MSYAVSTDVSVESTRAQIESLLARYGATRFGYGADEKQAVIYFVINNLGVRFELPLPDRNDFKLTETRKLQRTDQDAYRAWEQGCRSAWRALLLCIKAKLEACEAKITSFEAEFLAHIVTPSGKTFGDMAIPQISDMRDHGKAPQLQIGWNGKGPA
jgi:hypothetical protein